jgi:hypothetical protein
VHKATLVCAEYRWTSFQIQLKEDVPAYLLKVKAVCPHFPWWWMEIDGRPMLVSPEEASPDRSKGFNLIMHKVWRLKAFSSENEGYC